jgi:hypothetical protein
MTPRVVVMGIPWSGVTPDGALLLLHDLSSQEVDGLDFEAPWKLSGFC